MNIPGYNPQQILNPYVFADYGNPPTRLRGQVSPVVMQTAPPSIRDPYLDAIVEALEGDAPTGGGAFVGGHLAPDSSMLGNYHDRRSRGGELERNAALIVAISTAGIGDAQAQSVLSQVDARLQTSPLFSIEEIGWGTHRYDSTILARLKIRMGGTSLDAVRREIEQALVRANARSGGANLQIATIARSGPRALDGVGAQPQTPDEFGEDIVSALFSRAPAGLLRPPAPVEVPWWERSYVGMPFWALGGLLTLGGGAVWWGLRRRKPGRSTR